MKARDFWVAAFLLGLFVPPLLRLLSPERQGLGQELVTISGLVATSLVVSAVVLPARLRSLTRAFGIEAVLANHRIMGLAAAVAALAHLAAVVLNDPRYVALALPLTKFTQPYAALAPVPLLDPMLTPPVRAMAAIVATGAMVVLVWWAARRQRDRHGGYEVWRRWHMILTAVALVGIALHVLLIAHLVPTWPLYRWMLGDPIGLTTTWGAIAQDPAGPAFLAVLAIVLVAVGVHRWVLRPLRRRSRFQVARVHRLNETASTFVLRREDGAHIESLKFRPGQFAWLRLRRGPFTEEHPFTISSAAQENSIEFTIRHSGDWTTGPLRQVHTGDFVWLDGPHGDFTPTEETTGMVLIAGGVGITPGLSILRTAANDGDNRAIRLLLADRPGEGLFLPELEQLAAALQLEIHELGRDAITAERLAELLPPGLLRAQQDYYVCGPPSLVQDVVAALGGLDVPAHRVHTEQFHS